MNNKKLSEYEESRRFVFHGSPSGDLKILEPRQGRHVPDLSKPDETILDGNPAISATPYLDFAIFRALINKNNIPFNFNSGFGFKDGKKEYRVSTKEVLDAIKDKRGYVYVFNKNEFVPYARNGQPRPESMEWRSYKEVSPIEIVEVTFADMPPEELIEISD